EVEKKQLKKARKDKKLTVPIEVKLNSVAGDISFKNELTLVLTEEDDTEPLWLVNWDPSFIYPGMEKGGKIFVSYEVHKRGEIIDKNRMSVALNDSAQEIVIITSQLEEEKNEKEEKAILLEISTESIDKTLTHNRIEPDHYIPLKPITRSSE